ncbi:MFS transporter [Micromonospora sp. RTGN7]|uniref:MFS transporter n=1 Tax=Micromonospora sp. RTGN7 TaxID=3016526 RepID=UPI0029FF1ABF|nr:MFS transporter [Micromonospora sp. RTGN7]
MLRERNFRVFILGYSTSAVGTSMATVVLAFAVLEDGGSLTDLSLVMAARIVPMVLFLIGGGVLGDRLPRRTVMLYSDCLRALAQGGVATLFIVGTPPLWALLALVGLGGLGEAVFRPSFDGLMPSLVSAGRLQEANALLGLCQSTANVGGPALAGVLVALTNPSVVLVVDGLSYLPSIVSLLILRLPDTRPQFKSSVLHDLRSGWRLFWSYPWLWTVTLQFTLFNLVVWAPYLVLGPPTADRNYGGAGAWGAIVALYGAGSIVGGLFLLGRRPQRPLVVTTLVTFAWAAPSAALALQAPLAVVCLAAIPAGIANSVFNGLWLTTIQQHVPSEAISRVMSFVAFGAYSVGPIGLALAGPIAEATSISAVLAAGVIWQLLANSLILAVPAVRGLRSRTAPEMSGPAAGEAAEATSQR